MAAACLLCLTWSSSFSRLINNIIRRRRRPSRPWCSSTHFRCHRNQISATSRRELKRNNRKWRHSAAWANIFRLSNRAHQCNEIARNETREMNGSRNIRSIRTDIVIVWWGGEVGSSSRGAPFIITCISQLHTSIFPAGSGLRKTPASIFYKVRPRQTPCCSFRRYNYWCWSPHHIIFNGILCGNSPNVFHSRVTAPTLRLVPQARGQK